MIHSSGSRWYVVHTRPNSESRAALNLVRQNFEVLFPRYLKRRRHARRVDAVVAPLFPRYIFVAIDMAMQRWRAVHSTIGVSHLVSTNGEPVAVPDAVIEQLKSSQDERGLISLDTKPRFAAGDKVHVMQGVFSAYAGVFECMTDSERVSVLIEMLGRQVRVVLDVEAVEAA
jgi:transcriptional antiterminator RfaH